MNPPPRLNVKQLFESPETFGTTLLLLCADRLGYDFLDADTEDGKWSAATMRYEIKDIFNANITDANLDKLMAAMSLVTPQEFYSDLITFITLTNAICGNTIRVPTSEPLALEDIGWSIFEAQVIGNASKEKPEYSFSEDILAYISYRLKQEMMLIVPKSLQVGAQGGDPTMELTAELNLENHIEKAYYIDGYVTDLRNRLAEQILAAPFVRAEARKVGDTVAAVIEGQTATK